MVEDIVRRKGYLTLGSRLRRIGERLQAETQRLMAEYRVPIQANQYPLLGALDEYGPLSVGEIAEALGISQPGVTRSVGQLAKQGIVKVRRGSKDQRTRVVELTPFGRETVCHGRSEVWPRIEFCVKQMVDGQTGPLLDQLDRLEEALEAVSFSQRVSGFGGAKEDDHDNG